MNEEPSIWLKFSGKELDVRSIPIYELGDTLVAVQRIIHKTFQFENGRLKKGAHLTQAERKRLSLQISERRKSSDLYALIPFAADPALQQYLLTLLKVGLGSLAKYALKSVLSPQPKPGTTSIQARDVEEAGVEAIHIVDEAAVIAPAAGRGVAVEGGEIEAGDGPHQVVAVPQVPPQGLRVRRAGEAAAVADDGNGFPPTRLALPGRCRRPHGGGDAARGLVIGSARAGGRRRDHGYR